MKNFSLFLALFFLPLPGFAQTNALSLKVQEAHTKKSVFQKPELFQFAGQAKSVSMFSDLVAEGDLLTLNLDNLKALYFSAPEAVELALPNGSQKPLTLELVKHRLLTEDFTLVTSASNGQPIDYQPGAYYRGIVKGEENSLVAISIFEDEIIGVVSTQKAGNMVLGRTDGTAKSANYIFYKEDDLLLENSFECGASEEAVSDGKEPPNTGNNEKVAKCVRAYLEAEFDLVTEKGGAVPAANFLTGLFNVVAAIYQNEAITTYVSQIFAWIRIDPYATSSTSAALTSFRDYRPTFNGDVAHLISRGAPTGGGIAWVDALCTSYAYAYSYINSTYSQFPTYSWSVNVLAHEMGHNLGSPHTHACAWNGNNTAIDGCGPTAGSNEGCTAPLPTAGTMMSYCHLISGVGINFNLGFGTQPGDKIRTEITAAGCLVVCATQCLTVTTSGTNVSCFGGNNGTATASATGGTAPFTYAWSTGGNTQTLNNLVAGTYTVTVTAAGNCTGTATRIVTTPAALSAGTTVTNATGGQSNGAINLSVSGGTPAFAYLWSNGATTEDISGLSAGAYTVTVTDSKGCTATKSATVSNSAMTLSFAVTNTTGGQNNGAVNLTVGNGTAPFTYSWSNGATTEDLANVAAGNYSVTVSSTVSGSVTGSATVGASSSGCLSLPQSQGFESGLGTWTQATNDQMDWTLFSGSTPTASTGPAAAFNGSFYAYTEATGFINKTAYLLTPCYNITGVNTFQVNFNYHMYGSQMGTLYLQFSLNNSSTWNTVWSKTGNQTNVWKSLSLNFTNNNGSSIRFRFYGKTGAAGDKSDMAIDNFAILQTGNLDTGAPDDSVIVLYSTEGEQATKLALSPNPASDQLLVSFFTEMGQEGKITVVNQMGRTLKTEFVEAAIGNNFYQLDVADLSDGLYFLTVEEGSERRVERFVVLR